jgi:hypothetical protein
VAFSALPVDLLFKDLSHLKILYKYVY